MLSATEQFHDLGLHIQSSQPYALKIFDLIESEPVENSMYTHRQIEFHAQYLAQIWVEANKNMPVNVIKRIILMICNIF